MKHAKLFFLSISLSFLLPALSASYAPSDFTQNRLLYWESDASKQSAQIEKLLRYKDTPGPMKQVERFCIDHIFTSLKSGLDVQGIQQISQQITQLKQETYFKQLTVAQVVEIWNGLQLPIPYNGWFTSYDLKRIGELRNIPFVVDVELALLEHAVNQLQSRQDAVVPEDQKSAHRAALHKDLLFLSDAQNHFLLVDPSMKHLYAAYAQMPVELANRYRAVRTQLQQIAKKTFSDAWPLQDLLHLFELCVDQMSKRERDDLLERFIRQRLESIPVDRYDYEIELLVRQLENKKSQIAEDGIKKIRLVKAQKQHLYTCLLNMEVLLKRALVDGDDEKRKKTENELIAFDAHQYPDIEKKVTEVLDSHAKRLRMKEDAQKKLDTFMACKRVVLDELQKAREDKDPDFNAVAQRLAEAESLVVELTHLDQAGEFPAVNAMKRDPQVLGFSQWKQDQEPVIQDVKRAWLARQKVKKKEQEKKRLADAHTREVRNRWVAAGVCAICAILAYKSFWIYNRYQGLKAEALEKAPDEPIDRSKLIKQAVYEELVWRSSPVPAST